MKKMRNTILWILEIIMLIIIAILITSDPGIPASSKDLSFYRLSMALLFIVPAVNILIEIDPFKIKKRLPLVKSNNILAHFLFTFICIVIAVSASLMISSCISGDFREAIAVKNAGGRVVEKELESDIESTNGSTVDENEAMSEIGETGNDKESSEEAKREESVMEQMESKDRFIIVEEDSSELEEPKLIEEETYYFDDADYTVNGIVVHIDSITLERKLRPEGYFINVSYNLENQNVSEASFGFSDKKGNRFVYNGKNAMIYTRVPLSNKQRNSVNLKGFEKSDHYIGNLYTRSMSEENRIEEIEYGPIEVGNLYSGEEISIVIKMLGYLDGTEESIIVSFDIEL